MASLLQPVGPRELDFGSRRSVCLARSAMVACTQPLACEVGLQILRAGGNAADAAVAIAAALNVRWFCHPNGGLCSTTESSGSHRYASLHQRGLVAMRLRSSTARGRGLSTRSTGAAHVLRLSRWTVQPRTRFTTTPSMELLSLLRACP